MTWVRVCSASRCADYCWRCCYPCSAFANLSTKHEAQSTKHKRIRPSLPFPCLALPCAVLCSPASLSFLFFFPVSPLPFSFVNVLVDHLAPESHFFFLVAYFPLSHFTLPIPLPLLFLLIQPFAVFLTIDGFRLPSFIQVWLYGFRSRGWP